MAKQPPHDEMHEHGPPPHGPPAYGPPPKQDSALPIVGGIFLILGAIANLWFGYIFLAAGDAIKDAGFEEGGICQIIGTMALIFGILALIGGIFAIMKKKWPIALIGGILGIFGIGYLGFPFLGSLFCLIGMILVAISRRAFD